MLLFNELRGTPISAGPGKQQALIGYSRPRKRFLGPTPAVSAYGCLTPLHSCAVHICATLWCLQHSNISH